MKKQVMEIATGGRPVEAFVAVAKRMGIKPGDVWLLNVGHDDGCPCMTGSPMLACTCEIVEVWK